MNKHYMKLALLATVLVAGQTAMAIDLSRFEPVSDLVKAGASHLYNGASSVVKMVSNNPLEAIKTAAIASCGFGLLSCLPVLPRLIKTSCRGTAVGLGIVTVAGLATFVTYQRLNEFRAKRSAQEKPVDLPCSANSYYA